MKKSIKGLEKLGLNKEQILEITKLDETQYEKYRKQARPIEIEDLPKKLDLLSKGSSLKELNFSKLYDEIFKENEIEILELPFEKKVEMIKEFPNFIKYIEIKKLSDKISELKNTKENLSVQMNEIDRQMSAVQMEMDIINLKKKVPASEETAKEIPQFIVNDTIKIYRKQRKGGMQAGMKREKLESFKIGNLLDVADKGSIVRYIITYINIKGRQLYIKPVKTICTVKE